MTPLALTDDALALYRLIHRGGAHVYLWGKPCDPTRSGTTRWFHPGERPAVFGRPYNSYHGVHPTTQPGTAYQRAKKGERDIAVINCLYADEDDKDHNGDRGAARAALEERIASGTVPRPTVTVDSGGGVQLYWGLREPSILATEEQREWADRLQKRWVAFVGSDDGAKDLARVLRVPGTLNFKYDPLRPVAVLEADYSRLYTLDELEALLPPEEPDSKLKPACGQPCSTDQALPTVAGQLCDFTLLAEVAQALADLHPDRCNTRNDWRDVGMAIHATFPAVIGLPLWDQWSRQSAKYDPQVLVEQWKTFNADGGITIATLLRMAKEDRTRHDPGGELTEEQWTARLLDRTDIPDRLVRLAREVYRFLRWRRRVEGEGVPIRAYPQQFATRIGGSKGNVSAKMSTLEQMGLIIRDSYTYQEDGQLKGALYLMEGPAFDDPALLTVPAEQGKAGGDHRSAAFQAHRRCPEHPDALMRVTIHRTAEYACLDDKHGEDAEPFFIEDLPALIRTVDPRGNLAVRLVEEPPDAPPDVTCDAPPDDAAPDTAGTTGFKIETNTSDHFKTETVSPDDGQAAAGVMAYDAPVNPAETAGACQHPLPVTLIRRYKTPTDLAQEDDAREAACWRYLQQGRLNTATLHAGGMHDLERGKRLIARLEQHAGQEGGGSSPGGGQ